MAIILPSGFNITNVDPIDARFTVSNQSARLGFSAANVYEGLIVYQQDTNETHVLVDTGSYNSLAGWQLLGFGAGGLSLIATGSVSASVNLTDNVFLVRSGSFTPFSISNTGATTISGSASNLFLIKSANNTNLLIVSQSGVVTLATSSFTLTGTAPNGGIYFTSSSFYVGID